MNIKNEKIFDWFTRGNIKEAIIGENNYFIPDVTYREHHDRLLVFRQLFIWSDLNKKTFEVSKSIEEMIHELCSLEKIFDVLDIIWCFLIIKEEAQSDLSIDMDTIEKELITLVNKNSQELSRNDELRELVLSLAGKLPKFRNDLNL